MPRVAAKLQHALGLALRSRGLAIETRRWRPHVTLARRANVEAPQFAPVVWPLHGHVLAESRLRPRTAYEVIAGFE